MVFYVLMPLLPYAISQSALQNNEWAKCVCVCVYTSAFSCALCMQIVYVICDVSGQSVVASFHGNTSLRAQIGVETIMVAEGTEKGRAWWVWTPWTVRQNEKLMCVCASVCARVCVHILGEAGVMIEALELWLSWLHAWIVYLKKSIVQTVWSAAEHVNQRNLYLFWERASKWVNKSLSYNLVSMVTVGNDMFFSNRGNKGRPEVSLLLCFLSESLFRQVATWQTSQSQQMSPWASSDTFNLKKDGC